MKLFIFMIFSTLAYSSGNHSAGQKEVELKPWSAVTQFNELDGFQLSEKAQKNLNVKFMQLKGKGPWKIPSSALLKIKHSHAVFRKWNGWITMILVKIIEKDPHYYKIKSVDLQQGDDIAISGVPFLRMTEADLHSDTVDSCSH
ncbi:MAG: hypothetical protein QF441_12985 [Bacteriovoracaceae bacterium]|jgi:hypothetical protein|nr:hypothetical protein [Halobacteriovoraceae bacterium]MDP7321519.1 hypothetical protein [Bacteriovoracaceae bacterium]|tara:strand:+ start:63 stop:494 length:432 start_codon:yes stop_codon:yes gene_type:complete